jgi:hypothetical protein
VQPVHLRPSVTQPAPVTSRPQVAVSVLPSRLQAAAPAMSKPSPAAADELDDLLSAASSSSSTKPPAVAQLLKGPQVRNMVILHVMPSACAG